MNKISYFVLFVVFFLIVYSSSNFKSVDVSVPKIIVHTPSIESYKKHYKIRRVIAFVFYGRKKTASILFRYLDRNLKVNGGILDKVIFAVRTDNKDDLLCLENFLKNNKHLECCYEKKVFATATKYKELYTVLYDDDLVFKIDDDVVFIANGTFEKLFEEYLNGNHFILSANVVNHPQLSYVHARLRAILPFIEVKNYTWEKAKDTNEIDDTVVMGADYGPMSKWWKNGNCAAIAHESFLYHANNNNLNIYDFKIWDFNTVEYHRWSVNFIVIWGKHLNKLNSTHSKVSSDEVTLTAVIPKELKKHSIALGSALVSHFSYWSQFQYLSKTDIIEKYDTLSFKYLKIR